MFSLKISLASLALLAAASAQGLIISSPASLTTCQPVALSWQGGVAPYYVAVLPGGQPSAAPLKNLGQFQTLTTSWTVDIPAGVSVSLRVTDGSGTTNYSSQVTIQAGTSTSCIGAAGNGIAAAPAAAAGSPATPSAAVNAASPSSASPAASSAPSSAVHSGAAVAPFRGTASALGLIGVAALALAA